LEEEYGGDAGKRVMKGYRNEGLRGGVVGRTVWGDAGKRVMKGYRNEGRRGGLVRRRVWWLTQGRGQV
jgi:hypothetical protein